MPLLRALATPPGVLPTACAFRWSEASGCSRAALWEPFSSQDGPSLTHKLSQRRQGLSKTSPGAHWASFEGPSGPSRAHLERHKGHFGSSGRPLHLSSSHIHHKNRTSKKHSKIHKILTILAFSGFSFRLSGSSRASLRALLAIFGPADALCDLPLSLTGPSWAVWALSWRRFQPSGPRPGGSLEAVLRPQNFSGMLFFLLHILLQFRAPFSTNFGAPLGRFWSLMGRSWGPLGSFFAGFRTLWDRPRRRTRRRRSYSTPPIPTTPTIANTPRGTGTLRIPISTSEIPERPFW